MARRERLDVATGHADEIERTADTVALVQAMIRNACVNDGRPDSGEEHRSADVVESYLTEGGPHGLEIVRFEPTPGRRSLVATLPGTDPTAPSLLLLGHTDVVPVTASGWRRDPFGGELVDGEVWGRGALDMLNLTASMAVALRTLARSRRRPRGSIVYCAVADEEAGGEHGARWLVREHPEVVGCDYVITESGGISLHGPTGHRVTITVGEKGVAARRLVVRGTPGHGSMPYGTDNALVKAAEVVRRVGAYRSTAVVSEVFRDYVGALDLPAEVIAGLSDPATVEAALARVPDARTARFCHACTHTTFSPNVIAGGVKINVIPDEVAIDVDIRTLPGQHGRDVDAMLVDALGPDLAPHVEIRAMRDIPSTQSAVDTPLFDALAAVTRRFHPEATLVTRLTAGGTDATFFREVGSVAYGFGLFSTRMTPEDFSSRFHGHDERIDVESLRLTTEAWLALADQW
jgi:acetylornithine deacetylase/succinyl-diaminopimelate desuccinylase-like protein